MPWVGWLVPNPVPITTAMVTKANQMADRPRYSNAADWNQGVSGHEIDIGKATSAKVGAESPAAIGNPAPVTQAQAMAARVPAMTPASDIGQDYGASDGLTGRAGSVGPLNPYPDASSPTTLVSVIPGIGPAAGGTSVTLSGSGFTGATAVTFGGTAGTAIVVGNNNSLTVTAPAKAAGNYDVLVTSPKGTSLAGVKFTYF